MSFETSVEIAEIAADLATAQGSFEKVVKESDNPFFKSKYADLATVIDATRKALAACHIAVVQSPGEFGDKGISVTTLLSHKSGQWMRGTTSFPVSKHDAQGFGSAVTYARRYALQAMLNVAGDDDDGNAASANTKEKAEVFAEVERQKKGKAVTEEVPPALAWSYNAASGILICQPIAASVKMSKDNRPFVAVKLNGMIGGKDMAFCWHKSMAEALIASVGKPCKFEVKEGKTTEILELLEVDGVKWEKPAEPSGDWEWKTKAGASVLGWTEKQLMSFLDSEGIAHNWEKAATEIKQEIDRRKNA